MFASGSGHNGDDHDAFRETAHCRGPTVIDDLKMASPSIPGKRACTEPIPCPHRRPHPLLPARDAASGSTATRGVLLDRLQGTAAMSAGDTELQQQERALRTCVSQTSTLPYAIPKNQSIVLLESSAATLTTGVQKARSRSPASLIRAVAHRPPSQNVIP